MASSTQFSIRSLMIVTVVVAIVSAILGPRIRRMEPEHQLLLAIFFGQVAIVVGLFVTIRFLQRSRVERTAGPLLWRTDSGEKDTRWAILVPAVGLATAAANGMMLVVSSGESVYSFGGLILGFCILGASLLAAEFSLGWWWQTGPLITEVYQNGLVLQGVVFRPWSVLKSYQSTRDGLSVLIVTESTRWGTRSRSVHVAAEDRSEFERALVENGVSPAIELESRSD